MFTFGYCSSRRKRHTDRLTMPPRPVSHSSSRPGPESQTLTRLFQARSEWDRLAQLSTLLKETQIDLPDFFDSDIGATICREAEQREARLAPGAGNFPPQQRQDSLVAAALSRPARLRAAGARGGGRFLPRGTARLARQRRRTIRRPIRAANCASSGKSSRASTRSRRACRSICASIRRSSRKARAISSRCAAFATRRPTARSFSTPTTRCCCAGSAISCRILLTDKNRVTSPFLNDNRSLLTWLTQWGTSGRCQWDDGAAGRVQPAERAHRAAASSRDRCRHRGGPSASRLDLNFEVVTAAGLREPLENARLFLAPKSDHPRPELELVCVKHCFYRLTERPPRSLMALALKQGIELGRCRRGRAAAAAAAAPLSAFAAAGQGASAAGAVADQILLSSRRGRRAADPPQGAGARRQALRGNGPTTAGRKTQSTHAEFAGGEQDDYIHIAAAGNGRAREGAPRRTARLHRRPRRQRCRNLGRRSRRCRHARLRWPGCAASNSERGELCGRPDNSGWWLILQPRAFPQLLQHWKDRSPSWQYFANRRFQHLISGKRRRFPKLKIQSTGIDWFSVQAEWEDETLR